MPAGIEAATASVECHVRNIRSTNSMIATEPMLRTSGKAIDSTWRYPFSRFQRSLKDQTFCSELNKMRLLDDWWKLKVYSLLIVDR
jgi:hypothetical protein